MSRSKIDHLPQSKSENEDTWFPEDYINKLSEFNHSLALKVRMYDSKKLEKMLCEDYSTNSIRFCLVAQDRARRSLMNIDLRLILNTFSVSGRLEAERKFLISNGSIMDPGSEYFKYNLEKRCINLLKKMDFSEIEISEIRKHLDVIPHLNRQYFQEFISLAFALNDYFPEEFTIPGISSLYSAYFCIDKERMYNLLYMNFNKKRS
ncbi:MAG: hypothetical protein INQ03_08880 [Candidatus Heimdallarchaeota archaeon]|nr:hypothetical protein [Candidatus Heimdallarchaeota archaeon]